MARACAIGGAQVTLLGREDRLDARVLQQAQVVLVAVRDMQLDGALRDIATWSLAAHTVVLHLSGNTDPQSALQILRHRGYAAGTFHPLVPLADPEAAVQQLKEGWVGIDGDEAAQHAGRQLGQLIGAHILVIPPGAKPLYHAAAVIASNFPVVLAALAARIMTQAGVAEEAANSAVLSLMRSSVENVAKLGAAAALTGPAVRGDLATIQSHVTALADQPDAAEAYRVLTAIAQHLAGGDSR